MFSLQIEVVHVLCCCFLFQVFTYPSFTELLLTVTVAKRLAYTEQDAFNYYLMTLAKSCPEISSFAQLPMQCQLLCYLVNSRPNLHIFVENMEDASLSQQISMARLIFAHYCDFMGVHVCCYE